MISFHRNTRNVAAHKANAFAAGFEWAEVPDLGRLAKAISQYVWSPCRWRDGRRVAKNFIGAHLIGLDFDDGSMTLAQAVENVFCDSAHIIGTTKSHRIEKNGVVCDRFRVVLRLDQYVDDLATYRATVAHYIDKYDCDSACKDGARFFWPCTDIVSVSNDGFGQEVIEPVEEPRRTTDYALLREMKMMPRWIEGVLRFGAPVGKRNTTCMKLGKYLTLCGFEADEIVALIEASPINLDRVEMLTAVRNGIKYGLEERGSGQEQEANA